MTSQTQKSVSHHHRIDCQVWSNLPSSSSPHALQGRTMWQEHRLPSLLAIWWVHRLWLCYCLPHCCQCRLEKKRWRVGPGMERRETDGISSNWMTHTLLCLWRHLLALVWTRTSLPIDLSNSSCSSWLFHRAPPSMISQSAPAKDRATSERQDIGSLLLMRRSQANRRGDGDGDGDGVIDRAEQGISVLGVEKTKLWEDSRGHVNS